MVFQDLLNSLSLPQDDVSAVGNQQRLAYREFPNLVAESNLNYWRPGDGIHSPGVRYLVGLAASFDQADLELADLMNELLHRGTLNLHVDVFNMEDCAVISDLQKYFSTVPQHEPGWHITPFVGKWINGVQVEALAMALGRDFILRELGYNESSLSDSTE